MINVSQASPARPLSFPSWVGWDRLEKGWGGLQPSLGLDPGWCQGGSEQGFLKKRDWVCRAVIGSPSLLLFKSNSIKN